MNKHNLIKSYLRERGMRVLDSADKKLRVDALEIQDLDLTIDDSGEDVEELEEDETVDEPADDDKPADDKPADNELWWWNDADDNLEDFKGFKIIGEEDTNEFRMPNGL